MKEVISKNRAMCSLALALLVPSLAMAGNLKPPAAPSDPASAVYTTDDIYNRLTSGALGEKRTGGFTEPSAGPNDPNAAAARKTLDEIMDAAPAPDDSTGLKPSEAPAGKPFWGLNQAAGGWGPQTGGSNANMVDTTEATAPAAAADIFSGKKAFVNGALVTGTMPNTVVFTCTGTLNGSRWCDNSNGTVRDMTTGLVWLQNADCTTTLTGVEKSGPYLTWDNARIWSPGMEHGACGLTDGSVDGDWRLPTKSELAQLTNGVEPVRSATPRSFLNVDGSGGYWSSSTDLDNSANAWYVTLPDGKVYSGDKTNTGSVWSVRGGN